MQYVPQALKPCRPLDLYQWPYSPGMFISFDFFSNETLTNDRTWLLQGYDMCTWPFFHQPLVDDASCLLDEPTTLLTMNVSTGCSLDSAVARKSNRPNAQHVLVHRYSLIRVSHLFGVPEAQELYPWHISLVPWSSPIRLSLGKNLQKKNFCSEMPARSEISGAGQSEHSVLCDYRLFLGTCPSNSVEERVFRQSFVAPKCLCCQEFLVPITQNIV